MHQNLAKIVPFKMNYVPGDLLARKPCGRFYFEKPVYLNSTSRRAGFYPRSMSF